MEELQENMKLLLDCLYYQQDSISSQKQALTTIAAMCRNHGTLCDHFRTIGGLKYVTQLLLESKSPELQIAAMYTLGCSCEQNMVSQRVLCDQDIFTFLRGLLIMDSNKGVKLTAAYFATCLMNGNVAGQNLAREMHVLESLIVLYKQLHPGGNKLQKSTDDINLTEDAKLFIGISSALCTAANNPQNELNQNLCSWIIPAALSIFTPTTSFQINFIRSAATLISACVANNNVVQERLRVVGGLHTCVEALKALVPDTTNEHKIETLAHIVKIIFTATADVKSCKTLAMLGIASVFLKLLQIKSLEVSTKLNTIICLGMITEGCTKSRSVVREVGLPILIDMMALSKNEELSRATTLIIKSCMEIGEQCTNPEDTDNVGAAERTGMMEAAGISPLNKVALQALDERKLSLKDNISQWLTTSDPIICPLDKNDECRQKKFDPGSLIHSSLGDRHLPLQPSSPALVPLKPLQKTLQYDTHSGPKRRAPPVCSSCEKECTAGNSDCKNGKAEKIQYATDLGMLQQQLIAFSKNANLTPMSEQQYVPQFTRSNVRYSARHQPANVFSRQCLHKCDSDPHKTTRSAASQCVRVCLGQQCLGCTPSKYSLLTSRNFCFHLQRDAHICTYHKQLLSMLNGTACVNQRSSVDCVPAPVNDGSRMGTQYQEKRPAHSSVHHLVQQENIGSDHSAPARHQQSKNDTSTVKLSKTFKHTPLGDMTNVSVNISQSLRELPCAATEASQRKQARFTEEETQSLITGVRTLGKRWRYILAAYPFNPCRTTLDLIDQYRILHAKGLVS